MTLNNPLSLAYKYYIRVSVAFGRARSASRRQLDNADWVAPVIYRHVDGSICMTLVVWKVPHE